LLPYDPVQKKRNDHGTKRGPADISDATGEEAYNVSSFGTKKGNGSSGVPLRYRKKEEYDFLTKAQQRELREWRMNKSGKSTEGATKKGKFDTAKAIASAVDKKVNEKLKSLEKEKSTNEETDAYIASVVDKCLAKTAGKNTVQVSECCETLYTFLQ
jgi:hypothetical protein